MTEPNSQPEKPKDERRYDPELLKKGLRCDLDQYEMLKRCSREGDEGIKRWNEWRKKHPKKDILLEGANLKRFFLKKAILGGGTFFDNTGIQQRFHGDIHFRGANFRRANLGRAELYGAHLQEADLRNALMENANFKDTRLEGANLRSADLRSAVFRAAIVDGSALLWRCQIDRHTDFTGVGLNSVRIEPGKKQLLEYNIRRRNWDEWYPRQNRYLAWLVRKFWRISDYGISTKRIIWTFFKWAFIFAAIYYVWGCVDYYLVGVEDHPGIVTNLFVLADGQEAVSYWLVPFRAVYFSIVTMTTLGFGDMYANAHSFVRGLFGHTLLAFQVILGYVLLGALITRFAVLFTAGGPAGRFADEEKGDDGK